MTKSLREQIAEFYADTYDVSVPDWPGEIDFYREMAAEIKAKGQTLLEVACGTGRVAIPLAREGVNVVGLDFSPKMLDEAKKKSPGLSNLRWVQADMRSFDLAEKFGLAIITGHAFQNLNEPQEQVDCLGSIKRHLFSNGILVVHLDHQDITWLGELVSKKGGVFEPAEQFRHPKTGQQIYTSRSWAYEPATQTAICQTIWEARDEHGIVVDRLEATPDRLHCIFRFEMEHLLGRVGFKDIVVYGDFHRELLQDKSANMIWVARNE